MSELCCAVWREFSKAVALEGSGCWVLRLPRFDVKFSVTPPFVNGSLAELGMCDILWRYISGEGLFLLSWLSFLSRGESSLCSVSRGHWSSPVVSPGSDHPPCVSQHCVPVRLFLPAHSAPFPAKSVAVPKQLPTGSFSLFLGVAHTSLIQMAPSPSVRKSLTAGKGWECGRDKLCSWFSCQTGGDAGLDCSWCVGWCDSWCIKNSGGSWSTSSMSCSRGKAAQNLPRGGAGGHLRACWAGSRRGPWRRGGWSTPQPLTPFLMLVTLPWPAYFWAFLN